MDCLVLPFAQTSFKAPRQRLPYGSLLLFRLRKTQFSLVDSHGSPYHRQCSRASCSGCIQSTTPTFVRSSLRVYRVVTRWHLTGTHSGADYLGKSASGAKIAVDGVSIDTIKDGVVLDGFDAWDALGFREQLGIIQPL